MFERSAGGLRVLTLNVAHGRGTAFHQALTPRVRVEANLDAVAAVLRAADADVVALQELDAPSSWSGRFCHVDHLARAAGYGHAYHGIHWSARAPQVAYGTGILSRYPVLESGSWAFGKNVFDTKGYVLARIDAPCGPVDVVSVHLDFKRDRERRSQLDDISARLAARPDPAPHLVIAGDFNCDPFVVGPNGILVPGSDDGDGPPGPILPRPFRSRVANAVRGAVLGLPGTLGDFARRHGLHLSAGDATFPSRRPRRRLDHVLLSPTFEVRRHLVIPEVVSDHLAVMIEAGPRIQTA